MKTVRILQSLAGQDVDGTPFVHAKGEIVSIPDDRAKDLCRTGELAELVEDKKQPGGETRESKTVTNKRNKVE